MKRVRCATVKLGVTLSLLGTACPFDDGGHIPELGLPNVLTSVCPGSLSGAECPCRGAATPDTYRGDRECESAVPHWIDAAEQGELQYSSRCIEFLLDIGLVSPQAYSLSCTMDATSSRAWLACEDECQIYFGSGKEGDSCERVGRRMSTCAADLACGYDGRCYSPCDRPLLVPEGGACGYPVGLLQEECEPGLQCDPAIGSCVPAPAPGAACDADVPLCVPGEWCSATSGLCMPTVTDGGQCERHDECFSRVCAGTCQPADPHRCDHPWF